MSREQKTQDVNGVELDLLKFLLSKIFFIPDGATLAFVVELDSLEH